MLTGTVKVRSFQMNDDCLALQRILNNPLCEVLDRKDHYSAGESFEGFTVLLTWLDYEEKED